MTSNQIDRMIAAPVPQHVTQTTAVEQSRAVAEVVAAVTAARQFPRDPDTIKAEITRECSTLALAEVAFYSVPNRGDGSTVHLARELARIYGHVQYGVHELHRDDAARMSEIRAYAWDPQSGTRQERTFQVPHAHMVGKGSNKKVVFLDDLDDVYRRNQNVGAKAVRECIFGVLPKSLVRHTEKLCRETLARGADAGQPEVSVGERARTARDAFQSTFGVTVVQLEERVGRAFARWTAQDVAALGVVFRSLQAGETTLVEEFPSVEVSVADLAPAAPTPVDLGAAPVVEEPPGGEDYDPTIEPGFGQA